MFLEFLWILDTWITIMWTLSPYKIESVVFIATSSEVLIIKCIFPASLVFLKWSCCKDIIPWHRCLICSCLLWIFYRFTWSHLNPSVNPKLREYVLDSTCKISVLTCINCAFSIFLCDNSGLKVCNWGREKVDEIKRRETVSNWEWTYELKSGWK